ncbi:MAG: ribonuclease Y [Actinomycetota bacterium]|nr:ribonuclease Y [Actinomycetota bacterium]MDQ2955660.1 ribonuclease Y [Actinomycetota bacterium]
MNHWIQLTAIVAVFVLVLILGLKFLAVYSHRSGAPEAAGQQFDGVTTGARLAEAEAEAEAIRQRAQRAAEAARQAADTEIESLRRAALTEAQAARAGAEAAKDRADAVAADLIADARRTVEREAQARITQLDKVEAELDNRTEVVRQQTAELEASEVAVRQRQGDLDAADAELAQARAELADARQAQQAAELAALERVAAMTAEQARQELLSTVEATARREAASLVRTIEAEARAEGTDRARAIVVEAVQRVASEQTAETVVSVLHLPSDEMKGRIIGREGRNIRAFESVTGVNVIIDDTPEAVLLSCFDPVRREIGRITLEKLVLDGRIHPHRIEEVHEAARIEVDELCLRSARDALAEVGITDLDERLIPTLGRLKYRTSYGQNVLGHLIETAHIAGIMAAELGLEPNLIRRSAFLHDIGKALTHEVEGSHAIIGAELLRKFGESEAVAHAVEAHHNEVAPKTIEAVLTQAADSCSASRPGARRESLEAYVKRLERIEEIATARPGVERVFAMQSGREVRVMVLPNEVDDLAAGVIAREVAKQIEDELTYPGQIRVTVVRESRATEVAH